VKYLYLITATGYIKTPHCGFSPRTFTFERETEGPWGDNFTESVRGEAYQAFYRKYKVWPSQQPQIDHIDRVHLGLSKPCRCGIPPDDPLDMDDELI